MTVVHSAGTGLGSRKSGSRRDLPSESVPIRFRSAVRCVFCACLCVPARATPVRQSAWCAWYAMRVCVRYCTDHSHPVPLPATQRSPPGTCTRASTYRLPPPSAPARTFWLAVAMEARWCKLHGGRWTHSMQYISPPFGPRSSSFMTSSSVMRSRTSTARHVNAVTTLDRSRNKSAQATWRQGSTLGHRAHRGWVCTACTLPQDRGSQYARCGPSSRSAAVYCSSRLTATRRRAVMTYRASYQWVGNDHAPCHCRRGQRPAVRASWSQTPTRLASVCNRANSGRAHWQQAPTPSGTAVRSAQNWYQPRCSCRKALLEPQVLTAVVVRLHLF